MTSLQTTTLFPFLVVAEMGSNTTKMLFLRCATHHNHHCHDHLRTNNLASGLVFIVIVITEVEMMKLKTIFSVEGNSCFESTIYFSVIAMQQLKLEKSHMPFPQLPQEIMMMIK